MEQFKDMAAYENHNQMPYIKALEERAARGEGVEMVVKHDLRALEGVVGGFVR
jgi:quinol monooxygenase YgiN